MIVMRKLFFLYCRYACHYCLQRFCSRPTIEMEGLINDGEMDYAWQMDKIPLKSR